MSRFMTNDNVIDLFKEIEEVKNLDIGEEEKNKKIFRLRNRIVEGLSFLVYNSCKRYRKFPNHEDLIQEGFIGLIKATKRFDYTLFPNFFIYAQRWINHGIKRAASRFDVVYSPSKKRVVYSEPSENDELVEETPEDIYFTKETETKINEALDQFSSRERDIVKRIFGLDNYSPQTLREVGPFHDLTYERVRQIKNDVISKLRRNTNLCNLY